MAAVRGYTRSVSGLQPARSGRFITIEGPEGAGKTSQAERLRAAMAATGQEVLLTREPGGTPLGERIRELLLGRGLALDPRADALLFSAARAQLVAEVVRPALARGALVISTRYADSTIAYQGFGAGLPIGELRSVEFLATGGLRADRTILLDLPVEVGLARKTGTELTRFEREFDVDFHRRVRAGFLELARAEPDRFVVVDATAEEDVVFEGVLGAAGATLGLGEPDSPGLRIHR
jgi:dTMP kinase